VRTVDGSQWDAKEIVVDEPNERVALTVPLVHATGTVTLDGKPIQAKLTLSQFGRSIIQTSEEGTFAATLPGAADGKWQIEIESEKPAVTSQLHDFRARVTDAGAVFDIVVPRTLIAGRCVDAADQSPLPHAIIDIQSVDAHTFRQTFAAPDGTFEAIGLPPGKYHVSAKDFLKESTAVEVEIGDDPVTDLVLALRPQLEFKGRLFAANGSPIPHARIYGRPADRNGAGLLADADTDGAGGFDLVLPPGTSAFDLLIAAPGFALSLARTQFSAEGVVPMYADQNGGHLNVSAKTIGRVQLRHGGAQWHAGLLARFNGGTYDMSAGIVHSGLVEAGPWSACIAEKCVSGFLAPGGELQLTLED
jgi:hypothetical protein